MAGELQALPELDVEELADVAQREHSVRRQRPQPHLQGMPGGPTARAGKAWRSWQACQAACLVARQRVTGRLAPALRGLVAGLPAAARPRLTSLISSGPIAHSSSTSACRPGTPGDGRGRRRGCVCSGTTGEGGQHG